MNHFPDAARIVRSNVSASVIQQPKRERLQVEPGDPFAVFRIQAMALDAMLSEFVTATVQFAFAETGHRRYPNHSQDFRSEREFWCAKAIWERS